MSDNGKLALAAEKALLLLENINVGATVKPSYVREVASELRAALWGRDCPSVMESPRYFCTLPAGHIGDHEAWGGISGLIASWPNDAAHPRKGGSE